MWDGIGAIGVNLSHNPLTISLKSGFQVLNDKLFDYSDRLNVTIYGRNNLLVRNITSVESIEKSAIAILYDL